MKYTFDYTESNNENKKEMALKPGDKERSFEKIIQHFLKVKLPLNWDELDSEEKHKLIYRWTRQAFPNLPESLLSITVGWNFDGDSGKSIDEIPEWLDREKFFRGQKFARDNLTGIMAAGLLCLFCLYAFEDGFKSLIVTRKSSEPYTAFKRYLQTVTKIRSWYSSDPWTKGTQAYDEIKMVRRMHIMVREKLHAMSEEEIDEAATIKNSWSPMKDILVKDYRSACPVVSPGQCPFTKEALGLLRFKKLNQGEMALTQGSLVCLVITRPKLFGIHDGTDENLDDFCHMWKGIGYLLGIEDEFNFCHGSFEDIKERSENFLNEWVKPNLRIITPEWEHMMRCLFEGMQYIIPGVYYEPFLLYVMELINIDMPRLRSTIPYSYWIVYYGWKYTLIYGCQISVVRKLLNKIFNKFFNDALAFTDEQHMQLRIKSAKKLRSIRENNKQELKMEIKTSEHEEESYNILPQIL